MELAEDNGYQAVGFSYDDAGNIKTTQRQPTTGAQQGKMS